MQCSSTTFLFKRTSPFEAPLLFKGGETISQKLRGGFNTTAVVLALYYPFTQRAIRVTFAVWNITTI